MLGERHLFPRLGEANHREAVAWWVPNFLASGGEKDESNLCQGFQLWEQRTDEIGGVDKLGDTIVCSECVLKVPEAIS
jgi:hypothetical protein